MCIVEYVCELCVDFCEFVVCVGCFEEVDFFFWKIECCFD